MQFHQTHSLEAYPSRGRQPALQSPPTPNPPSQRPTFETALARPCGRPPRPISPRGLDPQVSPYPSHGPRPLACRLYLTFQELWEEGRWLIFQRSIALGSTRTDRPSPEKAEQATRANWPLKRHSIGSQGTRTPTDVGTAEHKGAATDSFYRANSTLQTIARLRRSVQVHASTQRPTPP
jgi:hypothetical protein